jgi:hypothetical protein
MTRINDINTPALVMQAMLKFHPDDKPYDTPVVPVRLLTIGMRVDIGTHLEHILQHDVPTLVTPSLFNTTELKHAINHANDEWFTVTGLRYDAVTERILITLDDNVVPDITLDPDDYVQVYTEDRELEGTIWEKW